MISLIMIDSLEARQLSKATVIVLMLFSLGCHLPGPTGFG